MKLPSRLCSTALVSVLAGAVTCLSLSSIAFAANTDLSSSPLVTSSTTSVYPNVLVMMDDSGSMNWDFLPDNSDYAYFPIGTYGYASSQCNGVYYNPNITYMLPYKADGTQYPASSFTAATNDGFGVYSGTVNLSTSFQIGIYQDGSSSSSYSGAGLQTAAPAFYYSYLGSQSTAYQKNYLKTSSTFFTECDTAITSVTSTFTIKPKSGGAGATGISSITVNGSNITSGAATAQAYPYQLGNELVSLVSASGYSAVCAVGSSACSSISGTNTSTATITITGPSSVGGLYAPVVNVSGGTDLTMSSPTTFPSVPPFNKVIVSSTSGPGGTDERQNFANWYTYYRTRINMMKSSLGIAFQSLGSNYQVGFATMNNNGGSDLINLGQFTGTQKTNWYSKVYASKTGGGTGLVDALARAGKLYANKLTTLNNVTTTDPVGYSCQQNFTILSTDGYWNVASTTAGLTGGAVGNQDGGSATIAYGASAGTTIAAARPYCDGNTGCSGSSASGSGSSNTLADVAMYYYMNDLRTSALGNCTSGTTGNNVCTDNVPTTTQDTASWHHMTLFTLGLGAPGYMLFDPNYQSETANSTIHDYFDVVNGRASSTSSCTAATCPCPWDTAGTSAGYSNQPNYTAGQPCEWPIPNVSGIPANVDDLWHAAVNGRGSYYSATNATALSAGLSSALAAVKSILSNSAAATTSSPNVTSTSNYVFTSDYTSAIWDGELGEQTINITTGALNSGTVWTAATQLDAVTYTSRNIYFNSSGALTAVSWTALPASLQADFTTPHISSLSQFCSVGASCLTPAQQTAAAGTPLLNFILGDRSNEGASNSYYFRPRTHVLGDIVDSQAAYVGPPLYQYADSGYSSFVSSNSSRQGAVYVGSNDGMLHAFNATTGAEMWAFIPTAVFTNLYKLADKNYAGQHQYFVDGTPVTGDAYFGGAWHTILIGGLNDGGQAYYALDVTNPASPSLLWEFTDANLGYTYGNPVVTKLQNGTWVVLVASGYNNNTTGDGKGHLYVLNAQTGAILSSHTTVTSAGSTTSPSGLSMVSAWVNYPLIDNTALRAYGGDLQGNLWRFDINGGAAPQLIVTLKDSSGNAQPITTIPELGEVGTIPMVYIGTGEYLGISDLTTTAQQSFYGIKDTLATTSGAIYPTSPQSSGSNFIQQTLTDGTCPSNAPSGTCSVGQQVITSTNNAVNLSTNNGWYINFPNSGERDNTNATLVLGTLTFSTNIPSSSACVTGGSSYQYFLNYATGGPISTSVNVSAKSLGNVTTTSPSVYETPSGGVYSIDCFSNGTCSYTQVQVSSTTGTTRRVGWHETN